MREILLVTSGKGGVGKSTISALIALKLSNKNKVLLIDSDMGLNNLDLILNIKSNGFDISDVVKGRCDINQALNKIKDNLYLLNLCLSIDLTNYPDYLLETIIYYLKDDFDYIILDSPAGIEKGFNNALKVSSKVIVVLNDELTSYEDARKIKRLCKVNNINQIIYLMNRFNKKESFKEYVKTRVNYYLSGNQIIFIDQINGNIYRKYRMLTYNKEFNRLISDITKGNVVNLF